MADAADRVVGPTMTRMSTPSSNPGGSGQSQGDQGKVNADGPEPPPDISGIEFDTIFRNQLPGSNRMTSRTSEGVETRDADN